MAQVQYWFGFRQPPGGVTPRGPYESYEKADTIMQRLIAPDCEVKGPFVAENEEEATRIAKSRMK